MKKSIIITIAVFLIISSVGLIVFGLKTNRQSPTDQSSSPSGPSTIDYSPPTATEQAAGDEQKTENVKEGTIKSPATTANIVLVDAGHYDGNVEIRAYVSNVLADGSCTATLTNQQHTVVKKSTAFKDAKTTQCSPINIPRSDFKVSGAWTLVVTFEGSEIRGRTEPRTVEIK